MKTNDPELEDIELRLLMEGVYQRYGHDFRDYAPASLKRRAWKCVRDEGLQTISALQEKVLHDPSCMARFLDALTIDVTAMFRDPGFYRAFRQKVAPLLRAYPYFRVWHAGCATGEEVYSMAILLEEEGLYHKAKIYATDMNDRVLQIAKSGIFSLKNMKDYTRNYQEAGGKGDFSDYYTARYDNALFRPTLQRNIVWAQHNLVTDASFNEFQVILCRNVMIYFNQSLQARVHNLLYESLAISGLLVLGSKESLRFTSHEREYEELDGREKIYRRVR